MLAFFFAFFPCYSIISSAKVQPQIWLNGIGKWQPSPPGDYGFLPSMTATGPSSFNCDKTMR